MNIEIFIALMSGGVGGILTSLVTLLVKDSLDRRKGNASRKRAADVATYQSRIPIRLRSDVAAYIGSGRFKDDRHLDDLRELLEYLNRAPRRPFLHSEISDAYGRLIDATVALFPKRLDSTIRDEDVRSHNMILQELENTARRFLGEIPETIQVEWRHEPRIEDAEKVA